MGGKWMRFVLLNVVSIIELGRRAYLLIDVRFGGNYWEKRLKLYFNFISYLIMILSELIVICKIEIIKIKENIND